MERKQQFMYILGGGFKYFYFHPYLGKISNLTNICQRGWNHQPVLYFGRIPGLLESEMKILGVEILPGEKKKTASLLPGILPK